MGRSYNDLKMETMKEKMIKLNEEYEKTKLLREFEKWQSAFVAASSSENAQNKM